MRKRQAKLHKGMTLVNVIYSPDSQHELPLIFNYHAKAIERHDVLLEVWRQFNHVTGNEFVKSLTDPALCHLPGLTSRCPRSLSIGDAICFNGKTYAVSLVGFRIVTPAALKKIHKMDDVDRMIGMWEESIEGVSKEIC